MPKPVLGRGLDHLMTESPANARSSEASASPVPATISPGLGTLLKGYRPAAAPTPAPKESRLGLTVALVLADLALTGQGIWVLYCGPTSGAELVLSLLGVALGAWLGCLAFLLNAR